MDPAELMRLAVEKARVGIGQGQTPFGCAIARGSRLLAVAHNTVWESTDPTSHAEMNALRLACQQTQSVFLEGAVVATTCEPCPMCMAALHWARVEAVYFGASIADASDAGFNELRYSAADLLEQGGSRVRLQANLLRDACRQLFDEFNASPRRRIY
jgi:tRNA(Arg) A34 adenosine deaminase TadA